MDFNIIFHNSTSISTRPNATYSFLIHALGFSFCYELHASRSNTHQSSLLHQTPFAITAFPNIVYMVNEYQALRSPNEW